MLSPWRFWLGIGVGLVLAGILYVLMLMLHTPFGYVFRGLGYSYIGEENPLLLHLFFAGVSLSLGQAVSLGWWIRPLQKGRLVRRRLILTSLPWLFWCVLMVLGRYATLYHLVLSDVFGPKEWQTVLPVLQLIAVLLPLVVFFNLWNPVLYAYRARRFCAIALVCWCVGTGLFACFRPIRLLPASANHQQPLAPSGLFLIE